MMITEVALFLLGLVLLVKGSDFFVKSAAIIAKRMGVSEFVIGLTLVAVGTSIPELAAAIAAAINKNSGLIMGTVVGANMANIGLVVGVGAIIMNGIRIRKSMLVRDGYIMVLSAGMLLIFAFNKLISEVEAAIFLLLYFAYIVFLFERKIPTREKNPFVAFVKYFFKLQYLMTIRSRVMTQVRNIRDGIKDGFKTKKLSKAEARQIAGLFRASITKDLVIMALSGIAIIAGAGYVVKEASYFASALGVPSTLIGISMVAIGTSLPELSVSISAARNRYGDMIIGTMLGSNIARIFLVLGITALINPLKIDARTVFYAIPFMIMISLMLLAMIRSDSWNLTKKEGMALLLSYLAMFTLIFVVFS